MHVGIYFCRYHQAHKYRTKPGETNKKFNTKCAFDQGFISAKYAFCTGIN